MGLGDWGLRWCLPLPLMGSFAWTRHWMEALHGFVRLGFGCLAFVGKLSIIQSVSHELGTSCWDLGS